MLVPSGYATDFSATVEVTYYFFGVISSEAEKSARFSSKSNWSSLPRKDIQERHLGSCGLLRQNIIALSDV